jgi:DNA-binding XRE family transcriptional regulator
VLSTVRRSRTLSCDQLAQLIDVSLRTCQLYESGALIPPPEVRVRIAAILATPHDMLWPPRCAASSAAPLTSESEVR